MSENEAKERPPIEAYKKETLHWSVQDAMTHLFQCVAWIHHIEAENAHLKAENESLPGRHAVMCQAVREGERQIASLRAENESLKAELDNRTSGRWSADQVELTRLRGKQKLMEIGLTEDTILHEDLVITKNLLDLSQISYLAECEENKKLRAENEKLKRVLGYRRPTHGPCCTCQRCGKSYDECRCNADDLVDEIEITKAQNQCYRKALEWYAEQRNYISREQSIGFIFSDISEDSGRRAREALREQVEDR